MVGLITVKLDALEKVPHEVVTEIVPVVDPMGTRAMTEVAVLSVNVVLTPLNLTSVMPLRFVPVMVNCSAS